MHSHAIKKETEAPLEGTTKKKRTAAASSVVQVECDVSAANQSIPTIDNDRLALAIIKHCPHKTQEQCGPLPDDHTGPAVRNLSLESLQDTTSPVSLAGPVQLQH